MFKDDDAILLHETNYIWPHNCKSVSSTCTHNSEFDGNGQLSLKSFIIIIMSKVPKEWVEPGQYKKTYEKLNCQLNRKWKYCAWEQESRCAQSESRVWVGTQQERNNKNTSLHSQSTFMFTKEYFINYFIGDNRYIHQAIH